MFISYSNNKVTYNIVFLRRNSLQHQSFVKKETTFSLENISQKIMGLYFSTIIISTNNFPNDDVFISAVKAICIIFV